MQAVLNFIKKILPEKALKKIRPLGHGFLAYLGAALCGYPSRKMVVVGITGTAGKSTTVRFLSSVLNAAGRKTGYITTIDFFDGDSSHVNKHGMSMPGRFMLQKELKAMADNGCKFAIVECTSEGLAQNRHRGIDFDVAAITNLAEAHLDSHGGFEKYKQAKARLFQALQDSARKPFFKEKILLVNKEDAYKNYFLEYKADRKIEVGFEKEIVLKLPGEFNKRNAIFALEIAEALGVTDIAAHRKGLAAVDEIPGRMQEIKNNRDIRIYLDYAPEPVAMGQALEAAEKMPHNRIIHVFGSTGGHRDVSKRFEFGKISAQKSNIIIVTNDDVYDSDPEKIAEDVRQGIESAESKRVSEVITVLDRRAAIKKAVEIALPGDLILITGKGSEQFLVLPGNKRIPWDEKTVIEESL